MTESLSYTSEHSMRSKWLVAYAIEHLLIGNGYLCSGMLILCKRHAHLRMNWESGRVRPYRHSLLITPEPLSANIVRTMFQSAAAAAAISKWRPRRQAASSGNSVRGHWPRQQRQLAAVATNSSRQHWQLAGRWRQASRSRHCHGEGETARGVWSLQTCQRHGGEL